MKKEEIVDSFLTKAMQYLESAESFATREVPIYIEELLSFKYVEAVAELTHTLGGTSVCIAILIISAIALAKEFAKPPREQGEYVIVPSMFLGSIALVLFFVSLTSVKDNMVELYKIKKAPRVYLIEYLKK